MMQQQTIVGLYPTRARAQDVQSKLQAAGIPASNISLSADHDAADLETAREPHQEEGFWDWLFGSDVSAEERERYSGRLRSGSGSVAVSVRSRSDTEHDKVIGLLDQFDPIDIDNDETTTPVPQTGIAGDLTGASQPVTGSAAAERRAGIGSAHPTAAEGDQVIPVIKEELEVGKRQVEQRHRIRTHVIERPVEQEVRLRDDTISVERRPVTQPSTGGADAFNEREFVVVERDEEAVVSKRARVKEEVVVRKDVTEHVETVRDTVRETEVDIDRDGTGGFDRAAAGSKPASPTLGTAGTTLQDDSRTAGETAAIEARDLNKGDKGAFRK